MKKSIISFFALTLSLGISVFPAAAQNGKKLKTIIVDAGHGGKEDPGAIGQYEHSLRSKEKDITLAIALKLVESLKKAMPDVNVIPTRTTDVYQSPVEKANIANENKGDLFLCIHADSGPLKQGKRQIGTRTVIRYKITYKGKGKKKKKIKTPYEVEEPVYEYFKMPLTRTGTSVWIFAAHKTSDKLKAIMREAGEDENEFEIEAGTDSAYNSFNFNTPEGRSIAQIYAKRYQEKSERLATYVNDEVEKTNRPALGVNQRQVGIWVLQATNMPAILIETGFINNPEDEKYLNSEEGQKEMAESITNAVLRYKTQMEQLNNGQTSKYSRFTTQPKTITVKVSNEFKIGILGVVAIALMVLGFNFLKGNKLFTKSMILHARYQNVQGLTPSNPVIINGLQVGTVKSIENDRSMKELIVTFAIHKEINIPANSFAHIHPNPLTITRVEIILGDSSVMLKNNDSIRSSPSDDYLEGIINSKVDPVLLSVNRAISTLDSVLNSINTVFDQQNKKNIASTIQHLERISASVQTSTSSLEVLVDKDNGNLAKTLNNARSFTDNLVKNNDKLTSTIDNLNLTSKNLSALDLRSTLFKLDSSISGLKTTIGKINSKEGSLGLLLNDPTLYRNLSSTSNKINTLIDDLRLHPKRYVSFSVFGKSDKKENPLSTPLPDSLDAPYQKQKTNP